jgi:hypothetical protein
MAETLITLMKGEPATVSGKGVFGVLQAVGAALALPGADEDETDPETSTVDDFRGHLPLYKRLTLALTADRRASVAKAWVHLYSESPVGLRSRLRVGSEAAVRAYLVILLKNILDPGTHHQLPLPNAIDHVLQNIHRATFSAAQASQEVSKCSGCPEHARAC